MASRSRVSRRRHHHGRGRPKNTATWQRYDDPGGQSPQRGPTRARDRLPWVDGEDNFAPLESLAWQVHVYGKATPGIEATCREWHLHLDVFPWRCAMRRVGLRRDAVYRAAVSSRWRRSLPSVAAGSPSGASAFSRDAERGNATVNVAPRPLPRSGRPPFHRAIPRDGGRARDPGRGPHGCAGSSCPPPERLEHVWKNLGSDATTRIPDDDGSPSRPRTARRPRLGRPLE